MNILFNY